jgi:hypothetical protein
MTLDEPHSFILLFREIFMTRSLALRRLFYALSLAGYAATPALASDSWKIRFPLSGTLGGEIVAPASATGFFVSASVTKIDIDKVSGDDGDALKLTRGGVLNTAPQLVLGQPRTATYSGQFTLGVNQKQTQTNLLLGYVADQDVGGGRLLATLNLPYIDMQRTVTAIGATPLLGPLSPAIPAPATAVAQGQVQALFNTQYQAQLAALSASGTGSNSGLGDAEASAAWLYSKDGTKIVAGVTLAMPTAKYDKNSGLNVGFGNYYTLRPGIAYSRDLNPTVTFGVRTSLGLNSPNTDNGIRSGNFYAIDMALAARTPIGVVGPHLLIANQYEADQGGQVGENQFKATAAGVFFTTLIPGLDAGLNLSYMKMLDSRYALSGSFIQARVSKKF